MDEKSSEKENDIRIAKKKYCQFQPVHALFNFSKQK